jgi:UDP-N-acetylmuramyl pentapeptide phosphotransferase/UDP-N-acetylglucosamine-1-phosphate transferase
MFQKISLSDMLILLSALASLIYAVISYFNGEKDVAMFVGLWVPSLLGFGIYINLLKRK